jgi:hypothetical protein
MSWRNWRYEAVRSAGGEVGDGKCVVRSGHRKGETVERATGVAKMLGCVCVSSSSSAAASGEEEGFASRVSPLSHETALALRFSYGQCSSVSRI